MRYNYWSCTKFADFIRGKPKLNIATIEEWSEWKKEAKIKKVRYWLAETGLDQLQNIIYYPYDVYKEVKAYIYNRFFIKTHALIASPQDIKPGSWCDLDSRILFCLFNELQIFVESELALSNAISSKENQKKYNALNSCGPKWKSRESGLEYLDWASKICIDGTDELSCQAKTAIETKELYLWWTDVYRNRLDPYEASGYYKMLLDKKDMYQDLSNLLNNDDERRDALKKAMDIENAYIDEENEMLIRLIKIRKGLWN